MTALDGLADRYVDEFAALDPCLAALMGIAGQDARLTDYGPDGLEARAELTRRTLAELGRVPVRDEAGRIAAAVLRERLEVEAALDEAGVREQFLDTTDGPVQRLRMAVELLDQGPDTDWEAVRARMGALPGALAGLRASLRRACGRGRVAARRQVLRSARECAETPAYLAGLAERYGDGPLRGALGEAASEASAALEGFASFLSGELAACAPERDALGADRYRLGVRDFLGTDLDLAETYAWGWEELARIESEMAAAAREILPGEPLGVVMAALDADPVHRVGGADAFRGWIQELADRAIADLDGVHFDIPGPLRRIECRIPPVEAGIYYLAPAEDLSRPGTVFWTVEDPSADIVTWTVPTTMFHEGVPGHHLQLGVTTLNRGLNRFQRLSSELHPGHCEGWGLYAERLMDELGHYRDPAHRLGMLAGGQRFRAARVVLDIGLHLELPIPAGAGFHEGERWTPELGLEFLRARKGPDPDSVVAFEIDRYLGRPGQAIAYKLGERVWLEAREAARRREGAGFDLKGFHRRALDLGPMGLDLLRAELARS
ncbi:DUF885 domain-containing protein [Actinomadura mexicana]|uniref:Uncharacterized conserved protein, DUF885 familyt n=1 Tax=Actinomadura mexicana TaxID=134959 RepID=A0A238ZDL0_9ACTN|nr:DUF885 domain-containing protein [Actinomadura mexicana]SNR81370.1 Uncharacterized conserved protein, DUF885 familyt [Actinomadura mexicana]